MDHHHAATLSLVEKYLLDELSPEQREEFEAHYFDCTECALDLRATSAFLEAAKEQLKAVPALQPASVPAKAPRASWLPTWLWSPAFAIPVLAACLLVISYQNLVVYPHYRSRGAELRIPQILPSVSLAGGDSRGDSPVQSLAVRPMQPFSMRVDIPTQDRFSSYTCLLYAPSGSLVWQIAVSAQQAKDTVVIGVPPANLKPGSYTLVVQGITDSSATRVDLEHDRFLLKFQE